MTTIEKQPGLESFFLHLAKVQFCFVFFQMIKTSSKISNKSFI